MPENVDAIGTKPAAIVAIECEALFGTYTYTLHLEFATDDEAELRLLLLYGDNGSGKTTIAQLIFHMLSPAPRRGHRTFLARTKFRSFSVHFDGDTSLIASRDGDKLEGPYTLTARNASGQTETVKVGTDDEGTVSTKDLDDAEFEKVLSTCVPGDLAVYFLSDDRVLHSDVYEAETVEDRIHRQRTLVARMDIHEPPAPRELSVEPSVTRLESWLRQEAIRASRVGEVTTSQVYTDIIGRITRDSGRTTPRASNSLGDLLTDLEDLAKRSLEFTPLGLAQPVPMDTLTTHIASVAKHNEPLLASVLEPYVNSIRSRLDASSTLQRRLSGFLDIINGFYRHKSVRITIAEGISVFDDGGEELDVNWLSSGEKQLMLLLSSILVTTTRPSLFIIDEPELSLNVKWQRQLVAALLSLVADSPFQYIMATHSIELLTRHKDSVLQLEDPTKVAGGAS